MRMKADITFKRAIADGITQLRVWHLIGTEIEVPEIYEFTYDGKDYTLEVAEGYYTLRCISDDTQYMVVVAHTRSLNVDKQVFIFESREAWSDWADYASAQTHYMPC